MVSKTEDKSTKKSTVKKAAASKAESKKTTKSAIKASAKTTKKTTKSTAKTVKEPKKVEVINNDKGMDKVVNEILEYNTKYVKSERKKAAKEATKGEKAESKNAVQTQTKENALKAFARKFAKQKDEPREEKTENRETCSCFLCKITSLSAWGRAYKNIFDYKGRTSFYEFWSFALINCIFMFIARNILSALLNHTFYFAIALGLIIAIASFLASLSLSVRRIHDTGRKAWKGMYMNLIIGILLFVPSIISPMYIFDEADLQTMSVAMRLSLVTLILVTGLYYLFYTLKLSIVVLFGEQDNNANEYGIPAYTDIAYKNRAVSFACWYIILCVITSALSFFEFLFTAPI